MALANLPETTETLRPSSVKVRTGPGPAQLRSVVGTHGDGYQINVLAIGAAFALSADEPVSQAAR